MTRLLTTFLFVLALLPATASAAPTCPDDNADPLGGSGAVYGVGSDSVIAGAPGRAHDAGAIVVRNGRRPPHTVTLADVPGAATPAAGDGFGSALATGMLIDGRPCTDILAGAPGRGGTGAAYLLFGSKQALPRAATELKAPDAAAGDRFGAAVAISRGNDETDRTTRDLWIGAPGRDVAGQSDAGAVYHYTLTDAGQLTYVGVVTQGSPQAPDVPEAGDRFGELLTPVVNGVIVGVPHEDVGSRRDAGAIELLRVSNAGVPIAGRYADQSGFEKPEAGDRFGAAVADASNGVAAGAPGEDLRGRRDAGLVELFTSGLRPRRTYRAGARGVPGHLKTGDRFGSALAAGMGIDCQESYPLAVGVPGRDLRGSRNAGGVTLISAGDITDCDSRELSQGHGLAGKPHRNARIGATLGIAQDRPGLDEDEQDTLLVGIPAGGILTFHPGNRPASRRLGRPPGATGYGSVYTLASDPND